MIIYFLMSSSGWFFWRQFGGINSFNVLMAVNAKTYFTDEVRLSEQLSSLKHRILLVTVKVLQQLIYRNILNELPSKTLIDECELYISCSSKLFGHELYIFFLYYMPLTRIFNSFCATSSRISRQHQFL